MTDTQLAENPAENEELQTANENTESNQEDTEELAENPDEGQEGEQAENFVKTTDPAVQKRINDLYKQTKMSDARNQQLLGWMEKQQTELEELRGRFAQTDHASAESILNQRLKEARESGDDDAVGRIQNEIIDFRVEAKLKQQNPPKQEKQAPIDPTADPQFKYLEHLANERDETGQYARPWLLDGHPQVAIATQEATKISQRHLQEYGQVNVADVMEELDEVMKKKQPKNPAWNSRQADPMGSSNLTRSKTQAKLKLSDREKSIAKRLGVSEDDYRANKA